MTLFELIKAAIKEDMPSGDLTTESLAMAPKMGHAKLIAKQDLILSGSSAFEQTMLMLDPTIKVVWHFEEGQKILQKQIICTLQGDLVQILKAERVALNFLMHLSGIATLTRKFVDLVNPYGTKILDTRKTTPAYRELEKRAVVHGGGLNHRLNLSTAILIKDNHISMMSGITPAVERVRSYTDTAIEVEAKNISEVKECVGLKIQRVLLDNMNNDLLKQSLALIPPGMESEASGNMSLDRVAQVAELGVNYISVGALTHSAPSVDVSLLFDWGK